MSYTIKSAAAAIASGETTLESIATETGWPIIEGCLVPEPEMWHADDGNAGVIEEHPSGRAAAQSYVDGGEWGDIESTIWVSVSVWRIGYDADGEEVRVNEDTYTIALDPSEPDCIDGEDHDWQSPYEIVGGIRENPGVWGSGGGVVIHEACLRCGCGKTTDTWAQDPDSGVQGLTSESYEPGKYETEVRDRRLQSLDAIAEDEGEWTTDRLVRDSEGDYYLLHLNGGERGAHQTDGNYFPALIGPTERINRAAALAWLDEQGYGEDDAARLLEEELNAQ